MNQGICVYSSKGGWCLIESGSMLSEVFLSISELGIGGDVDWLVSPGLHKVLRLLRRFLAY